MQKKIVSYNKFVRNVVYHDDRVRNVKFSASHSHVSSSEHLETVLRHSSKIFFFCIQLLNVAAHFIPEIAAHYRNGLATVDKHRLNFSGVVELAWHPQQLTAWVEYQFL